MGATWSFMLFPNLTKGLFFKSTFCRPFVIGKFRQAGASVPRLSLSHSSISINRPQSGYIMPEKSFLELVSFLPKCVQLREWYAAAWHRALCFATLRYFLMWWVENLTLASGDASLSFPAPSALAPSSARWGALGQSTPSASSATASFSALPSFSTLLSPFPSLLSLLFPFSALSSLASARSASPASGLFSSFSSSWLEDKAFSSYFVKTAFECVNLSTT